MRIILRKALANPFLFGLLLAVIIWGGFFTWAMSARGHDGLYDMECCHNQDCGPVLHYSQVLSDPKELPTVIITTQFGTAPLTVDTKYKQSRDGRYHACILNGKLLCLYFPDGQ